jgi:hypothetical protein
MHGPPRFRGGGGRGGGCLHAHDPVLGAPPAVFPDDELRAVSRAVSRAPSNGWLEGAKLLGTTDKGR